MALTRVHLIAAVLVAMLAFSPAAAAADPVAIWVSPRGSDDGDGTRDRPFRSLQRAQRDARAAAASAPVRVMLLGGTYRLRRPLVLDHRDSGSAGREVAYRAAPGARPVLSGGLRLSGWTLHDRRRGIYRARVPAGTRSRQLYVDGRRATRAQSDPFPDGFTRTPEGFRAASGEIATWRRPADLEAVAVLQWKVMRCGVASVAGRDLTMRQPCWANANSFPALWAFPQIARLENAYELLDKAGEWYLDSMAREVYYRPRAGERLATARAELAVEETLIDVRGTAARPVAHLRFEGLTFAHATWLRPSGNEGYAADQSGFHLTGRGNAPNAVGHVERPSRTPGNVRLRHVRDVTFTRNDFRHLGGAGLDFDTGSQGNVVLGNRFTDISSAAVQVGGVLRADHHPTRPADVTRDNRVAHNLISHVGREYQDAAGVFVGYTTRTTVEHNDISDVPWSGIALGWGWGLVDPGSFPGLPGATPGMWGTFTTPTTSRGNRVLRNRIRRFLSVVWDGGAVYTQGRQGASAGDGELIAGNVASDKRPAAGGNVFYTDGGSRYVTLRGNVSLDNPVGRMDFGPCGLTGSLELCGVRLPYGSDRGGCRPFGDITYRGNYWQHPEPFWGACPYPPHPVGVRDDGNVVVTSAAGVPRRVLDAAGRQGRWRSRVGAG
ncbi:MAG: right-handed parallel beta-helix repeat-containing protein [Solirubrobacteraceae bacterium]|nr:right-handed parallel beta-helix repeat-containing protein [Solirubrobacteraceae bacterium]